MYLQEANLKDSSATRGARGTIALHTRAQTTECGARPAQHVMRVRAEIPMQLRVTARDAIGIGRTGWRGADEAYHAGISHVVARAEERR